jgi:hypothetical protein
MQTVGAVVSGGAPIYISSLRKEAAEASQRVKEEISE